MKKWALLLLLILAGSQVAWARTAEPASQRFAPSAAASVSPTPSIAVPTVAIPQSEPVSIPTVTIPQPIRTIHKVKKRLLQPHRALRRRVAQVRKITGSWILAYLTSYCPGSAGGLSSSGRPVFYGMLANNFYPFGTRVYIPVLGMTGVVEDRFGGAQAANHFDVWSPACYSTPTGWYRVAVLGR